MNDPMKLYIVFLIDFKFLFRQPRLSGRIKLNILIQPFMKKIAKKLKRLWEYRRRFSKIFKELIELS